MYPKAEPESFKEPFKGEAFSLREPLTVLRKRWWIIGLVALSLTAMAVTGFSLLQTPEYEASIRILVGQAQKTDEPAGNLGGEVQGLQQLTQTMAEGVGDRPIIEAVIRELDLQTTPEDIQKKLDAKQVRATQFIDVNYRDTSPERAQLIANAVGDTFSDQASRVSPSANVTATVWQRAELPDKPASPNPVRYALIALAVGVLLGIALAFLLEHLDDSWDSPEEVEQISGVPTYGVIATYTPSKAIKDVR